MHKWGIMKILRDSNRISVCDNCGIKLRDDWNGTSQFHACERCRRPRAKRKVSYWKQGDIIK